jgi:hypothetical protein
MSTQSRSRRALNVSRPSAARALLAPLLVALMLGIGVPGSAHAVVPRADASPRAATTYGLWSDSSRPTGAVASASDKTTLGVVFSARRGGQIRGVQFYRTRGNKGPHVAKLWTSTGRLVATAKFADTSSLGWRTAYFGQPVKVRAGVKYVAGYTARHGRFMRAPGALSQPHTHRALTAWKSVHLTGGGFPRLSAQGTNFYVDVVFAANQRTETPTLSGWPSAANTGVPAGVALSNYTGPCTVTTSGTVIDGKTINCDLNIKAANVVVRNSVINGTIETGENTTGYSFTIEDSEVRVGDQLGTGVGAVNFTARRVEVTGGNRSMNCWKNCVIVDSYVHGQFRDSTGAAHESGIRMGTNGQIIHNTVLCDAPDVPPDAGCSADLTGYGDFAAVTDMLMQNNLFKATTGGTCAYGGSSAGKPYSSGAQNIQFIGNVFERGRGGKCGYWSPVMDFKASAPGNVWSNNTWDDGTTVNP